MLVVSASAFGATDKDWLEAQMASAMSAAASWKLDRPEVVITDSQHVEVAGDGRIFIGSPLITRLRQLENGEQVTRFLLLHEIRHVMQKKQRRAASSPELECDSDYFAVLVMARESLAKSTTVTRNKDLSAAIAMQGLAASAGALALTSSSESHLSTRERFAAGAFATWRALHEYLTSPDLVSLKAYTEVRNRSKGFVAPADLDAEAWVADFCAAATRRSKISSLWMPTTNSTLVTDTPDGVNYFREEAEIENQSDRAMRLRAWPVMGLRNTTQADNFEGAAVVSADYFDVTIPAKSKVKANFRTYYPGKKPESMELFAWTSASEWLIATAQSVGERLEPPHCARGWRSPTDPRIAALYQFILRSGAVAGRKFEGVLGPLKYPDLPVGSALTYYTWASPPADVSAESSYIIVLSSGRTSGLLSLLETPDLAKAKAKFAEHVQAFRQACAASGQNLREKSEADGRSSLTVDYLTLSSEATLYLSVERDRKQPASAPTYSVSWSIRPKE
jgi:hypothetical protein